MSTGLTREPVVPSGRPAAAASPVIDGPCSHHHHPAGSAQTFFYFVVFPTNSAPFLHSNRIPVELLSTPPTTTAGPSPNGRNTASTPHTEGGACAECAARWSRVYSATAGGSASEEVLVGDFASARVGEEMAQQTLQTVAFPSAFGTGTLRPPPRWRWAEKKRPRHVLLGGTGAVPRVFEVNGEASSSGSGSGVGDSSQDDHEDGGGAGGDTDEPLSRSPPAAQPDTVTAMPTPPPLLQQQQSQSVLQQSASGTSDGAHPAPSPVGPPWNLRLEEVCNAGGQRRHYRILLTSTFTVMLSSRVGDVHSLQTRPTAVALVLTCPPDGDHYHFLLQHFDVCRALLHRVLGFGMRMTERFFHQLFVAQARAAEGVAGGAGLRGPQHQQRLARAITALLEKDKLATETYMAVKRVLVAALGIREPLPGLGEGVAPAAIPMNLTTRGGHPTSSRSTPSQPTPTAPTELWEPSAVLCTALTEVAAYSEVFLSAFVSGLLALRRGREDGVDEVADPHEEFWALMGTQKRGHGGGCGGTVVSPAEGVALRRRSTAAGPASSATSPAIAGGSVGGGAVGGAGAGGGRLRRPTRVDPTAMTMTKAAVVGGASPAPQPTPAAVGGAGTRSVGPPMTVPEGFDLSAGARPRVVVYCADAALAQRLMIIAAFFMAPTNTPVEGAPRSQVRPGGWLAAARHSYRGAVAARVASADAANVPVQWVPREFSEEEQQRLVSGDAVYSPDNDLLLVAPRLLLCRRLRLQKRWERATVLVEQLRHSADDAAVRTGGRGAAHVDRLFRCRLRAQEVVPPDALIATLLREAVALERGSGGVVRCSTVLADSVAWLAAHDRTRSLQHALSGVDPLGGSESLESAEAILTDTTASAADGLAATAAAYVRRPSLWTPTASAPVALPRHASRPHTPTVSAASVGSQRALTAADVVLPGADGPSSLARLLTTRGLLVGPTVLSGSADCTGRGGGGSLSREGSPRSAARSAHSNSETGSPIGRLLSHLLR